MQKVITGQVTNVEPRSNGWAAVHILPPGKQHPVKLSTKRRELLQAANTLAWQMADALYNEEQSDNINPHTGTPYLNRYLEQLAPAGSIPQPQAQPQQFGNLQPQMPQAPAQPPGWPVPQPQPQPVPPQQWPQPTQRPVAEDERETKIMRQAATKVAAAFLPMLAEEDRHLGSLIRISEQLLRYYREGVSWETAAVQVQQDMPQQQTLPTGGNPAGYENPGEYDPAAYQPPADDEDIPF